MDVNVQAFRVVQEAIGSIPAETKRRRAASRKGGTVGGRKRAEKLSAERRREIALEANNARWKSRDQQTAQLEGSK